MRRDGEAGTPSVDGHDFAAPEGRPWDRCAALLDSGARCGLGEAAHTRVPAPYAPPGPRPVTFHAEGCPWPQGRCTCRDGAP
jgi:hypothetical protein